MEREGESIREGEFRLQQSYTLINLGRECRRVYSGGRNHLVVHTLPTSPPHSF